MDISVCMHAATIRRRRCRRLSVRRVASLRLRYCWCRAAVAAAAAAASAAVCLAGRWLGLAATALQFEIQCESERQRRRVASERESERESAFLSSSSERWPLFHILFFFCILFKKNSLAHFFFSVCLWFVFVCYRVLNNKVYQQIKSPF